MLDSALGVEAMPYDLEKTVVVMFESAVNRITD
jgi:hypothetical protein